jgi:hypothetical protein
MMNLAKLLSKQVENVIIDKIEEIDEDELIRPIKRIIAKRPMIFEVDKFEQKDCTLLKWGDIDVCQPTYNCPKCDPSGKHPVCFDCIKVCHKSCFGKRTAAHEEILRNPKPEMTPFVCSCGKNDKHIRPEETFQRSLICVLRYVDNTMGNTWLYHCNTCNKRLCSVCFVECHKSCIDKSKRKGENEELSNHCSCDHENHIEYYRDEFALVTVSTNRFFRQTKIPLAYPIQYINVIFAKNFLKDLNKFLESFSEHLKSKAPLTHMFGIDDGMDPHDPKADPEQDYYDFLNINFYFSSIFERKFNTYYFCDSLLNLFPIARLKELIQIEAKQEEFQNILKLKSKFFNILLNLHIKKDYASLKSLTTNDFMHTTVIERLTHRALQKSNNIYTKKIHENYFANFNEDANLDQFIIWVLEEVYDPIMKEPNYDEELMIALKFLSYSLKKMLFNDIETLQRLINIIEKFHRIFIQHLGNNYTLTEMIKNIFCYFNKVIYLIAVNYNDLVIRDAVDGAESYSFVHTAHQNNTKLVEMLIKNSDIVAKHFTQFKDKVIKIFNETLKLFGLTDNVYYQNLIHINELDLYDYHEKLQVIRGLSNDYNRTFSTIFIDGGDDLLLRLKNGIEKILENYFYAGISCDDNLKIPTYEVNELVKIQNKEKQQQFLTIFKDFNDRAQYKINSYQPNGNRRSKEYIKTVTKKLERYRRKIITGVNTFFNYLQIDQLLPFMDTFVDELIISNIDETLSKYLFLYKDITGEEVDAILEFLSLYMFNEKGVRYMFAGKTLGRILGIIRDHPSRVLDYLYLLTKGLRIFKIDISYDKTLDVMKDELINYLGTNIQETSLIHHFSHVLKIFYSLAYNWEFRAFEEIKKQVLDIFIKKDLLCMDMFKHNTFKDNDVFFSNNKQKLKYNPVRKILKQRTLVRISARRPSRYSMNKFDNESKGYSTKDAGGNDGIPLLDKEEMKDMTNGGHQSELGLEKSQVHMDDDLHIRIVERKLFFSFIALISHNSFFKFNDKGDIETLLQFNDLDFFRHLFQETNIFLRYRTTLLNYLRNFYFMEIINKDTVTIDNLITTDEYHACILGKPVSDKIMAKFEHIKDIEKFLNILINEIMNLDKYINTLASSNEVDEVEEYIKEVVYTIKFVSDIFYVTDISSHMTFYFYKLAKEFLFKVQSIEDTLTKFVGVGDMEDRVYMKHETHKLMEDRDFNIYGKNEIYSFVLQDVFKIFDKTGIYDDYKLNSFLKTYDNQVEANYQPLGLEFNRDFDVFYGYDNDDNKDISENQATLNSIVKNYRQEFFDIYKTGLFKTLGKMSTDDTEDFRSKLIGYFTQFVVENKNATDSYFITIIYVLTRLLYFDTKDNQQALINVILPEVEDEEEQGGTKLGTEEGMETPGEEQRSYHFPTDQEVEEDKAQELAKVVCQQKDFFVEYFKMLRESIGVTMVSAKNFFLISEFGKNFNLKTKLMVQFLQLLSEGFCTSFDKKIFLPIDIEGTQVTIFEFFMKQLQMALDCINLKKVINGETPYDTLVVYISNVVDFLQEFIEGFGLPDPEILEYFQGMYFDLGYHNFLFDKIPFRPEDPNYCLTRRRLLLNTKIQMISLLKSLMTEMKYDESRKGGKIGIQRLIKHISPLTLFEEIIYYLNELITILQTSIGIQFNLGCKDVVEKLIELYVEDDKFRDSLELNFCFEAYLLLKVLSEKYKITVIDDYYAPYRENPMLTDELDTDDLKLGSINGYNTFRFLEKIVRKIEVRKSDPDGENSEDVFTFFIKPPETFHISKQTKHMFVEYDAIRDSTFTKIISLIGSSDYFLFEMRYNSKLMETSRALSTTVKRLNFFYLEVLNYILIFIHQILILDHFWKDKSVVGTRYEDFSLEEKYTLPNGNIVVAGVQLAYLFIILFIWVVYKFPLHYNKYLMNEYYANSSLRKDEVQKKFSSSFDDDGNPLYLSRINIFQKVRIGFIEAILTNREVIIYILNAVLIILFFTVKNVTFLSIPVLFIANLSNILFGIILSVKLRWYQLLLVLGFTYLLCYVYAWVSFYFIYPSMVLGETFDPNSVSINI